MKKIKSFMLIILLTFFSLTITSMAAQPQLYTVTDAAYIFTDEEEAELTEKAEAVTEQFGIGVYIVTCEDYRDLSDGDVFTATQEIYHDYTMGEGEGSEGVMLLLSVNSRDYGIYYYGENCKEAFESYGYENVVNACLDDFIENDWYGGFEDYIEECSECFSEVLQLELENVVDEAKILSSDERAELQQKAEAVSKKYGVGVYIYTCEDYYDYNSEGPYEATYTIYHNNEMGEGEGRDGIILLLSMKNRKFGLFCYGKNCEYAFDKYGQLQLEKVFLDDFADNDWYGGFNDYVEECSIYLSKAADNDPVRRSPAVNIMIFVGLSLLAGLLPLQLMWKTMNPVAEKTTAKEFVSGKLNLTRNTDEFTHQTTTKRKIERSSGGGSSSSGGGSVSESGGGGSGRSGSF
ncbi:MAG: TPM domain-containing protein [Lachnospiraceae bacterium]|nr:TPM domain-containing protein [Lachnospiraceae bacterium]